MVRPETVRRAAVPRRRVGAVRRRSACLPAAAARIGLVATLALAAAGQEAAAQQAVPGALPENDRQIFSMTRTQFDATRAGGAFVGSWQAEGWIGTDFDRLWWNSDGEVIGRTVPDARVVAMYGHYVATFWDAVVGYRHDFNPVAVNYLTAGIRGLAPYWLDVEALLAVSDRGKASATTNIATDWLLTQRLITRPEIDLEWPLMRDPVRQLSPGLGDATVRIATRYEFQRGFAPYVDLRWTRRAGSVLASERTSGREVTGWTIRAGLWLIF